MYIKVLSYLLIFLPEPQKSETLKIWKVIVFSSLSPFLFLISLMITNLITGALVIQAKNWNNIL